MSQHHHNITPELYLHLHQSLVATKAHVQETVRDRYTKRCHYARGTHRWEPQKPGNSAGRKEGQLALMLGRCHGDGDVMNGCNVGIMDSKTTVLSDSFWVQSLHKIHYGLTGGIYVEWLRSTPPKIPSISSGFVDSPNLLSGISASRQVFGLRHLKAGLAEETSHHAMTLWDESPLDQPGESKWRIS